MKFVVFVMRYSEVNIGPQDVERAVQLLERYSGVDPEKHALKDISWLERTYIYNAVVVTCEVCFLSLIHISEPTRPY